MAATDQVELRGMVARQIIDVIDAVSMARRQSRVELVEEILRAWSETRLHEANLVNAVAGRNPSRPERARKSNRADLPLWPEVPER